MGNWNTPNSQEAYPRNIGESYADFHLNNTQIKGLKASPITIVPSPGPDRALIPLKVYLYADTTGGAYINTDSDDGTLTLAVDHSAQPNAIFSLMLTGSPSGGEFQLFGGDITIAFDDDEATIQSKFVDAGYTNYAVSGGLDAGPGPVLLENTEHQYQELSDLNANGSDLTGGTDPDVVITVVQKGGLNATPMQINNVLNNVDTALLDAGVPLATSKVAGSNDYVTPNGGIVLSSSMAVELTGGDPSNYLRGRVWYQNVPFPG